MAFFLSMVIQIFALLILARVLLSWVPNIDPYNPAVRFIYEATEPFLKPVRELLPPMGGFDFSPIVLLIGVQVIGQILITGLS